MAEISIIVPVYNVKKYLSECLNSIRSQTYKDWVAILVDDGSTDCSGDICEEFAKIDSRFTVIHKANQGLHYARRDGLKATKTPFVTSIDSDDIVDQNYLQTLLEIQHKSNSDITRCSCKKFYDEDKNKSLVPNISGNETVIEGTTNILSSFFEINGFTAIGTSMWCGIYKTKLFENIDWEWSRDEFNEDNYMLLTVYAQAKKIIYVNSSLYFYRQHLKSLSHTFEKLSYSTGKTISGFVNAHRALEEWPKTLKKFNICMNQELIARDILFSLQLLSTCVDSNYYKSHKDETISFIQDLIKRYNSHKNNQYITKRCTILMNVLNRFGLFGFVALRRIYIYMQK